MRDEVLPAMAAVRADADRSEALAADEQWALPRTRRGSTCAERHPIGRTRARSRSRRRPIGSRPLDARLARVTTDSGSTLPRVGPRSGPARPSPDQRFVVLPAAERRPLHDFPVPDPRETPVP
jgi:hypothetical protein